MVSGELQEGLFRALQRFGKLHNGQVVAIEGLTQGEFFLLGALERQCAGRPQGVCVWEVAEHMRMSPPGASRMLRGLEEKGFIVRRTDPADRRNTCILLTPQGLEGLKRTQRRVEAFMARVIERMGEEDTRALLTLCNQMADIIQDEQKKERLHC